MPKATDRRPTRAIVYVRLSVFRGETDTSVSPEEQERRCRAYAESKGWQVVDVIRDLDVSASDKGLRLDRPGLLEVRDRLDDVDVVIFAKLDRLARNVVDFRAFADEAAEHGARGRHPVRRLTGALGVPATREAEDEADDAEQDARDDEDRGEEREDAQRERGDREAGDLLALARPDR